MRSLRRKPYLSLGRDELVAVGHARLDAAALLLPCAGLAHHEGAVVAVVVLAAGGLVHALAGAAVLLQVWLADRRARRAGIEGERILCAAVYIDTGEADPPRRSYTYPSTGLVFSGWRHSDCFVAMDAWSSRLSDREREEIGAQALAGRNQGFLTSLGRYVDRHEALAIAIAADQVRLRPGKETLYSEDLY